MFILDYTRASLYDFWGRLRDSIQVSNRLHNGNTKVQQPKDIQDNVLPKDKIEYSKSLPDIEIVPPEKLYGSVQNVQNLTSVTQEKLTKSTENLNASNLEKERHIGLLEWTRKKLKLKQETKEQSHEGTIPYLPSLDNLSTLNITINPTDLSENKSKENKSKKKFKKIKTFRKMLLKS